MQTRTEEEKRRRIVISADLPDMVDQTILALAEMSDGVYVQRGPLGCHHHEQGPDSLAITAVAARVDGPGSAVRNREADDEGNVEAKPKTPPSHRPRPVRAGLLAWDSAAPPVSQLPPVTWQAHQRQA